jgi:hypothetical protein
VPVDDLIISGTEAVSLRPSRGSVASLRNWGCLKCQFHRTWSSHRLRKNNEWVFRRRAKVVGWRRLALIP